MGCIHCSFQIRSEVKFRFCCSLRQQSPSIQGLIKNPDEVSLFSQAKPRVSSWGSGSPIEVLPIAQLEHCPEWEIGCIARFIIANRVFLQGYIQCVVTNMPRNSQVFFRGEKHSRKTISSNTTFLCKGIGRDLLYVK